MILYLKHIAIEGPETLGVFFSEAGLPSQTVELWQGEACPVEPAGYSAVIALGGPMNVYEEDRYPFLRAEHRLIQQVLAAGLPFLGICLGSQLLAKAGAGRVIRARQEEVGFLPVRLTADGRQDVLFSGLPESFPVFQWHGDTFDLPAGATHLASSAVCPHQAFRLGPRAYGLQFHVEITEKSIREWSAAYLDLSDPAQLTRQQALLADYRENQERFCQTAQTIYNNFLKMMATPGGH